jgi:hypothetical protein
MRCCGSRPGQHDDAPSRNWILNESEEDKESHGAAGSLRLASHWATILSAKSSNESAPATAFGPGLPPLGQKNGGRTALPCHNAHVEKAYNIKESSTC